MKQQYDRMVIFFGPDDAVSDFQSMTYWYSYIRRNGSWQRDLRVNYSPPLDGDLAALRQNVNTLLDKLTDCRVVFVKSITGIPYNILDKRGFIICETEAFDLGLLEETYQELLTMAAEDEQKMIRKAPYALDTEGDYFFDLQSFQRENPDTSSKKALVPFLTNVDFYSLELICAHIPPWFDGKLQEMGYTYRPFNGDDGKQHILVEKAVCDDAPNL